MFESCDSAVSGVSREAAEARARQNKAAQPNQAEPRIYKRVMPEWEHLVCLHKAESNWKKARFCVKSRVSRLKVGHWPCPVSEQSRGGNSRSG